MSKKLISGVDRREFLIAGAGVASASLLAVPPGVWAAPAKPDVVVAKGGANLDPTEASYQRMKAGCEKLGGLEAVVKGKHVLIKVNATSKPYRDGNTSLEATQALLRLCKESGATDITVVGQEWGGFDSIRAGQPTLRQAFKDANVNLVELPHHWSKNAGDQFKAVKPEGDVWHNLRVAKLIFEPDTVLLNLARLKTHPSCIYTGCLKNVIGLTMHMYGFHQMDDVAPIRNMKDFADTDGWHIFPKKLGHAFRDIIGPKIALNFLDAGQPAFGWRGPAPERIHTFDAHTTLVGTDALAMDVYGCNMLYKQRPDVYVDALGDWTKGDSVYVKGNKPQMNYLVECGKIGVGETNLEKVNLDETTIG